MKFDPSKQQDIQVSYEKPLAEALSSARDRLSKQFERQQQPALQPEDGAAADGVARQPAAGRRPNLERLPIRKSLLEPRDKDPQGWERLIGESNLVSINFLDRGRRAADAVCMIRVPAPQEGWRGSAFLVGQRLLMTNHHVLGSRAEASQAEAEFGYELDIDGVPKHPVRFNLAPHELFFTDRDLDITFVAINRYSDADVPIERYGRLPLIPMPGKVVDGEEVSIVQHPQGETKQIAIRASQIIDLRGKKVPGLDDDYLDKFIHYSTDTQPGSSGAPVFNDSWQVIAIHHRAIPDWTKMPRGLLAVGDDGETRDVIWLANEGVRISAIYRRLELARFSDPDASATLERLEEAIGLKALISSKLSFARSTEFERDKKPDKLEKWHAFGAAGTKLRYDPDFLRGQSLPLEDIVANLAGDIAPLKDQSLFLHYLHFSTAIDRERKFPLMTAVNIMGDALKHPGNRAPWRRDIRIDDQFQPDQDFYGRDKGTVDVEFDRGHLVRRFDPCWGDENLAVIANDHTFHYTNVAPQVNGYNSEDWGNLEDYVLNQAQTKEKRVSVFTGPIFRDDDPSFILKKDGATYKIPISYWKIAVIEKPQGAIAAVGFMIGQLKYVRALYEARVFSSLRPYSLEELKKQSIQVPISTIEDETGLNFAALKDVDTLDALEATKRVRFITNASDIVF